MKALIHSLLKSLISVCLIIPVASCGSEDEPEPAPAPNPGGSELIFKGKTSTSPVADPENIYTSTKSTYYISISDDAESAVMTIADADFLQGMPALGEMLFQPITCSFNSETNTLTLEADAITPEIAGRPFPAFPISDYSATVVPGKSVRINFICNYRGTPYNVTFTGSPAE